MKKINNLDHFIGSNYLSLFIYMLINNAGLKACIVNIIQFYQNSWKN
ncbi:hypothetical protein P343_08690 [Sporolactobacillus laevolacticus DSM 442]|uniref:Uncharacterized protein n=1 Tax=Sporolactobacillus laevolacticus DSM 442 TaxID=1395513 RepID=V6J667_9BACL|nr:hypothetical protein P343_08690 [Sporolactobacillus laevolacticus DSM 442]